MTVHSPGALHIHSTFSDGTGDLEEIARDARRAGLEWIGMTDHNTLAPTYRGFEGMHDGVAVLVGYEWTPEGGDHMLVYGAPGELGDAPLDPATPPADAIRILSGRGSLTHLAHPDERRGSELPSLPPYPWHDWTVRGMRGLELWNYMSEWAERLTYVNRLLHVARPGMGLQGPTDRLLDWWDRLNVPLGTDPSGRVVFEGGERLTVGVSGTDAHAFKVRAFGRTLTIFPYLQVFRTFTNYLLLDAPLPRDLPGARDAILAAIGAGRLYFANRQLGDALGLELLAVLPDGRSAGPGDGLPWREGASLEVRSPADGVLRVLRNGVEVARSIGRTLSVRADGPGAYRVEVTRSGRPWAYTNPVVLAPAT